MRIPKAPPRILILGQLDLSDIGRIEKLAQVVFSTGVRYSTNKELEMHCLFFLFFAHQQSSNIIIIKSITIPAHRFSMDCSAHEERLGWNFGAWWLSYWWMTVPASDAIELSLDWSPKHSIVSFATSWTALNSQWGVYSSVIKLPSNFIAALW